MVDEERVVTRTERVDTASPGYVPPATAAPGTQAAYSETAVAYRQTPGATLRRAIIFVFGIIQGLIILRIVLLLFAARQGNDLVATIYNISDVLVEPFRGMFALNRIAEGATALDVSAIVALVGWTIVEVVILALLRVFSRA